MSVDGLAGGDAPRDAWFGDSVGWRDEAPARPRRRGLGVPALFALAALAGGLILWSRESPTLAPVAPSVSRAGFVTDARLPAMMTFRQTDGSRARLRYEARQRPPDGERWDTLTVGEAGGDDALLQVALHTANTALARPSLFVELARQAADLDAAVVHATTPQSSATERGVLEWATITLSGPTGERACAGFRLGGAATIALSGLACGAHGAALDATALARWIDRLSATPAGLRAGLGRILGADAS